MPFRVQFSEYGDTDVLRLVDVPALSPDPGQVSIAVRAAGINPIDWKTMQGLMREEFTLTLPAGLGTDLAGVVDKNRVCKSEAADALGDLPDLLLRMGQGVVLIRGEVVHREDLDPWVVGPRDRIFLCCC